MRHDYQKIILEQASKLKFYIDDVRDYESIVDAFKGMDYVYMLLIKQVS